MSRESREAFIEDVTQKIFYMLLIQLKSINADKLIADHFEWLVEGYIRGASSYALFTSDIKPTYEEAETILKDVNDKINELIKENIKEHNHNSSKR